MNRYVVTRNIENDRVICDWAPANEMGFAITGYRVAIRDGAGIYKNAVSDCAEYRDYYNNPTYGYNNEYD